MIWKYYPLKFPSKSVADSVYIASSESFTWDVVDELNTGTEYFVNIAVEGPVPEILQSYVIPFPLYPKRVFFVSNEGVM